MINNNVLGIVLYHVQQGMCMLETLKVHFVLSPIS